MKTRSQEKLESAEMEENENIRNKKSYFVLRGQSKDKRKFLKTDKVKTWRSMILFSLGIDTWSVKWWFHELLNFLWNSENSSQFFMQVFKHRYKRAKRPVWSLFLIHEALGTLLWCGIFPRKVKDICAHRVLCKN